MPFGLRRSRPEAAPARIAGLTGFTVLLLFLSALPFRAYSASNGQPPGAVATSVSPSTPLSNATTPSIPSGDSLTVSKAGTDSAATQAAKSRTDSLIVVKHSFDHREQIITGSVIMSCLMLMMVAMNNYNPR